MKDDDDETAQQVGESFPKAPVPAALLCGSSSCEDETERSGFLAVE